MTISTAKSTAPVGSKRRGSPAGALAAIAIAIAIAVTALTAGCASKGENPPALAPQTVTSVGAGTSPPEAPPGPPPPPPPPPSAIEKTIVIDPGGYADNRPSLVAAAEAERERRSQSNAPKVVINDENLKSQAVGLLTVASPAPRPETAVDAVDPSGPPPPQDSPVAEDYWRERILEARQAWRELVDEIDDLESEVNLLRRRFYDEDDPYYRDSQIKPAWDRALDRLRTARLLADDAEDLVISTLEDGRRAGALPGWMREGAELEPTTRGGLREAKPRRLQEYEPGEPQIYDPDGDGDGGGGGDGDDRR